MIHYSRFHEYFSPFDTFYRMKQKHTGYLNRKDGEKLSQKKRIFVYM